MATCVLEGWDDTLWRADLATILRGFMMGVADVVPGVSGGTVALLTGIYPRLIGAVAGFDGTALQQIWRREWLGFAQRIDLRFLVALGGGILAGLVVTILTLVRLLSADATRGYVLAAFLGMLLAGAWLMYRQMVRPVERHSIGHADHPCNGQSNSQGNSHAATPDAVPTPMGSAADAAPSTAGIHPGHWGWALVGLVIAGAISLSQQGSPIGHPSWGYLFLCGIIGISAMILPGISGAMLLLLLGVYGFLVQIPSQLLHGDQVGTNVGYLAVFAAGCATGLLSTTRILKWALQRWPRRVSCFLLGLMIGAIPCLYPYQTNTTPDQPKLSLRVYEARWPEWSTAFDWGILATVLMATIAILLVDRAARSLAQHSTTG